ncbi:MAG: ATP synthase F1 subunit delta [Tissierellaceae bacterium]|nr:ATP synthase F1 subunit delta [Tissierellaceae bacterium]
MAQLIENIYATSIFEVSLELNKVEEFYRELKSIKDTFRFDEKLFRIFIHPRISKDEKKSIVNALFTNRISQEVFNFLYIIIDKRREQKIYQIIEEYKNLYDVHQNIVDAVAITAVPMDEDSLKRLQLVLENKLSKKVRLKNELDKSIIGGVLLKINNKVIDKTFISQLKSMKDLIREISL